LLVKAKVTDGKYVTMTNTYMLYQKVKDVKIKYVNRDIVSSKNLITTQTNENLDLLFQNLWNFTMVLLLQRVLESKIFVDGKIFSNTGKGLLIFVCFKMRI